MDAAKRIAELENELRTLRSRERMRAAVDALLGDLLGRRGFRHVWDDCDVGIQQEIKRDLLTVLSTALGAR